MAEIKLTKNELKDQRYKLSQLQRYLPTLQLKKALLQIEVTGATMEIEELMFFFQRKKEQNESFQALLTDREATHLFDGTSIIDVEKRIENIAGTDIPQFERVVFAPFAYSLFDTPLWIDDAIYSLRELLIIKEKIKVVEEKKRILDKELRDVSIRVNLFEKVMIPRIKENIKKIRVFLGDQQLAAVAQAKVAKGKILKRKMEMVEIQ